MRDRYITICIALLAIAGIIHAQEPYRIALINDDDVGFAPAYELQLKEEVSALLQSRTEVIYESYVINKDPAKTDLMIAEIYAEGKANLVIGVGLISSFYLAHRQPYNIPTISSVVIDRDLLGLAHTEADGSGITNFTYIETPFDIERDLTLFHQLHPYENLGIVVDIQVDLVRDFLVSYWSRLVPDSISFDLIQRTPSVEDMLARIGNNYDALYVLAFDYEKEQAREFYHELNHRGIPTFSLTGRDQVELGAMAGLAPSNYITTMVRRLALDVLNIYEGIDAATLPTTISRTGDEFVMNMQTLKHLDIYPPFELLNSAILLDIEQTEGAQTWSVESLCYEALRTNLSIEAAKRGVDIQSQQVRIAQSNLLPQLEMSSSAAYIDPNRVDNSNGQAADISWLANATLNQIIINEPVLANKAIQKLLRERESEVLRETELDIILETAQSYLTYLQARSIVRIQNENVDLTNQNLSISESKEALGYSGISDVYRLKTQLAQNVIDLNSSVSNFNQAKININRILNRDQTEEFNITDIDDKNSFSLISNPKLENLVNNQRDFNRLTDFFVKRAMTYLPELRQVEYALLAQERSLLSNKRSLYWPKLNVQGQLNQPIDYIGQSTPPMGFPGLTKDLQWEVSAQVSLPIFQGGLRKANIEKDKVSIAQIQAQQQDLKNALEAQVRSNMEIVAASYQQLQLSEGAAEYSKKNFDIIQDLYRQGQVDIITLVDAQNATLSAQLTANNALYQFIIDFITVERSTGEYYFIKSQEEKELYEQKFINALFLRN